MGKPVKMVDMIKIVARMKLAILCVYFPIVLLYEIKLI